MYRIQVNKDTSFEIEVNSEGLSLNGAPVAWDKLVLPDGAWHIVRNHQSYNVRVVKADSATKQLTIRVNNTDYQIEAKDRFDLLLSKLGMSNLAATKLNDIKAPMPGLVLQIMVAEGQELKKGDQVLILEAMKMENVLKSPGEGVVKAIKVTQGDAVKKGQVLVELA